MSKYEVYLKLKGYSKTSIKSLVSEVNRFEAWLKNEKQSIENLRYADVLGYIETSKAKGNTQRTLQYKINSIRQYLSFLQSESIIAENVIQHLKIQGVKRKTLYRLLSAEELELIYRSYPTETSINQRNKCLLGLILYQGLRTTELSKLTPEHLKLREGKIEIVSSRKYNGRLLKLEAFQVMDLMEYIYNARRQLLEEAGKESDLLFVSLGSSNRINNSLQKLFKYLRKKHPNVKNINQIHASVIGLWLKQYNLREVQYMAGHKYISSTESYLVNDIDDLQESVNTFFPL